MNLKYFFLILFISTTTGLFAQNYTLSGYIDDKETGEKLIGATIYAKSNLKGTSSNAYGFFSLTLSSGEYVISYSFVGYADMEQKITLDRDMQINIELVPIIEIGEVVVSANKLGSEVASSQMSAFNIPIKSIRSLPALMGEVDVIKTLQLLPGVQSGTEGASGLYVRGGGADQNLILLDGTPVYNASHLFGFFSVFNVDAINNIELIKGGFPARYGGRLSSVLDISLKEGNMKEFKGSGSIGIISSKLTLEGPIKKDKTSFIISGRRTYLDFLVQPFLRSLGGLGNESSQGYFFYDLNAKINHKFSYKDRLYLSVYTGNDKFYQKQKPYSYLYDGVVLTEKSNAGLGWGNITSALRWNHQFSSKLFSNTSITYSNYKFQVEDYMESIKEDDTGTTTEINSLTYFSGIEDIAAKIDFDFLPSSDHYLRFGVNNIYHTFKPGVSVFKLSSLSEADIDTTMGQQNVYANEFSAYIEDDYRISASLKANIGLHYSGFLVNRKMYHSLQPRLALRYLINESWSVKSSYAMMEQYIHLLTNNNIGLPTDLWVPATDKILPQRSQQFALGLSKSFSNMYQLSVEGYYKKMDNLIEYKDGASFMGINSDWQDKIDMGQGWSYGAELFFEKRVGKLTGWVGYTLSWTNRQFDNINGGIVFPYKYDRRHDISIVLKAPLNEKWDFSASWVFGTGTAHSLPTERYLGENGRGTNYYKYFTDNGSELYTGFGSEVERVDGRNTIRSANYHRFDISFQRTKEKKWGESTWTLGVYNAYNRKNPFYYYIGWDERGNRALRRVSLFPFIPSVSYSIKF